NVKGVSLIGSVVFKYNGVKKYQVEGFAPYAIGEDNKGDYNSWLPATGDNQVVATAYSGGKGSGSVLSTGSVRFTVVDQTFSNAFIAYPNPSINELTIISDN